MEVREGSGIDTQLAHRWRMAVLSRLLPEFRSTAVIAFFQNTVSVKCRHGLGPP